MKRKDKNMNDIQQNTSISSDTLLTLMKCCHNKKRKLLKPYQVNKTIMKFAKSDAIFMHCLPANRGEEVTNEVMDSKQSAVWLEALNRIHVQKSIIQWCLK